MRSVQNALNRREDHFTRHPFFSLLEDDVALDAMLPFAPGLAFWALCFQDVLRENERRVRDPHLRRIARHHRLEDAGHHHWLLADLRALGVEHVDVPWMFSDANESTRAASYALVSEVHRAPTDLCRIVLLLTLESSGSVFFSRIAPYMERHAGRCRLQYFSRSHLEVEARHELWERSINEELWSTTVDDEERRAATAVVERAYDAFEAMFDGLVARIPLEIQPKARLA